MAKIRIPEIVPPLEREHKFKRNLPIRSAFSWLQAGWRDMWIAPLPSLFYGLVVFIISLGVVSGLVHLAYDYILFPALAGFMVVGPVMAIGLYEKSRQLAHNEPITLSHMIFVRAVSGGQVLFIGLLLCALMAVWMRAAVLLYALFFGVRGFPGLDDIFRILVTTETGLWLLIVGSLVGGLFAAFSFAISVFSIPMMLNERVDALTAMGTSMGLVWNNRPVMIAWGAIVLALFILSLLTGLLGLIIAFPVLGHATWHAYKDIRWNKEPATA